MRLRSTKWQQMSEGIARRGEASARSTRDAYTASLLEEWERKKLEPSDFHGGLLACRVSEGFNWQGDAVPGVDSEPKGFPGSSEMGR